MQKLILVGFVGADPIERYTSDQKKTYFFSLGVKVNIKKESHTIWYKIYCWGSQWDNVIPHIKKGSYLNVIGDLKVPKIYKNKEGEHAIDLSVSANSISFLTKEKKESTGPSVFGGE